MLIVEVKIGDGRHTDTEKQIVKGVTDVFVSLGTSASAVTVILTEYPKDELGTR